jgi:hypothetical protein
VRLESALRSINFVPSVVNLLQTHETKMGAPVVPIARHAGCISIVCGMGFTKRQAGYFKWNHMRENRTGLVLRH